MSLGHGGWRLRPVGVSPAGAIGIRSDLAAGDIKVEVFRSGKPTAMDGALAPGQTATFAFQPTLHIGAVDEAREGQPLNGAILSTVNTQVSLLEISSADIVISGGGPGQTSTPLTFTLQNVVMA